ncbi:MAG: toll/interleukin-1 receptor domain-containing protein, partial [Candidatus Hermodarchaeota archaeon]
VVFNLYLLKYRKESIMFSKRTKEKKKSRLRKRMKDIEIKEKLADKELLTTYGKIAGFQKRGLVVFVSYATKDADFFKIKEVAEKLSKIQDIDDVLYWQENMKDNIIKYMNENLGKCDVFLLFCSPNALKSGPVEKEWTAAEILGKPIIPVFLKAEHIPPLLKSKTGIQYDAFDRERNLRNLQEIIKKHTSKNSKVK